MLAPSPADIATPAPAREPVITVRDLKKTYGNFVAVDGISFEIARGEIVAFLGPNGAGKTTTVEILEGYRERTAGQVSVLGEDPQTAPLAWRDRIGVVLQESQIEPDLTARECLELYAGYHFHSRSVKETLDLVGLTDKASRRGSELSGGQRRRLDVALALIGDPELIFLDEPTTGFDPAARRLAWEVIEGLRDLGKTIFLTTHYMDEAERLADRMMVISRGTIVAEGTPQTIGSRDSRPTIVALQLPPDSARIPPPGGLNGMVIEAGDRELRLATNDPLPDLAVLAAWAQSNGLRIPTVEVHRPTLEEIYLELTSDQTSS